MAIEIKTTPVKKTTTPVKKAKNKDAKDEIKSIVPKNTKTYFLEKYEDDIDLDDDRY